MIGIVIDHPSRDLPGLSILAKEFLKKNKEVALIPSYKIEQALINNPNDFELIIFNFYRPENYKIVLYAKSKKIKVAILDQESVSGIDGFGMSNIFKNIKLKKYLNTIDFYFFPSKLIMNECLKHSKLLPKNCIVSGYQRLDINKKKLSNVKDENFIIICTNFPAVNPAFTTKKKIIQSEIKYRSDFVSPKALKENILEIQKTIGLMKKEISKLVNDFKKIKFVIRPHPFENLSFWKELEINKNCKVNNDYNSLEWISKSLAVIHVDCSTSIEAALSGKPALSIFYANKKNKEQGVFKLANDCSYICNSYNELKIRVTQSIRKKLKPKISKKTNKFFYSPPTLSSKIIVDSICSLNSTQEQKIKTKLPIISYLKYFLEKFFGCRVHDFFLTLYRGYFISKQRKKKDLNKNILRKYFKDLFIIQNTKFFLKIHTKLN